MSCRGRDLCGKHELLQGRPYRRGKLYTDKKVKNGKLRFVVEKGIGNIVEFEPGVYATPIEESVARKIIAQL